MIEITANKINKNKLIDYVSDGAAGAVNIFVGTTRNQTKSRVVERLEFETHESMALKELHKIEEEAKRRWPVLKMAISHRTGIVEIGEEAVVIAVSTPHRKEAFEACQFAIDTLKKTVPIWKKEIFENGEVWVAAHP